MTDWQDRAEKCVRTIEEVGYVIVPDVLDAACLAAIREALAPQLQEKLLGRNNFEGHRTERVYSLVGQGEVFEELAEHPLVMGVCDAMLQPSYLLSASQAIHIRAGETAQPFHTDDAFYPFSRPRKAFSVATIWAIDAFTNSNGATQLVPGSHLWDDQQVGDLLRLIPFESKRGDDAVPTDPEVPLGIESDLVDALMSPGSVAIFVGTLVHRGGRSDGENRLALSNQYCEPWARPQENFFLSIPPEKVRAMSPRVQSLLGYSIHPPFMGHSRGRHPLRALEP